ncbi:hypothetical protein [Nakamurella lactea]|uniref:hypothetical protein n=1 Tax=Nakamurella lactea TaxID=459515 RepID=UPI00041BCCEF|nr:hypothetical protein [Nakamurella lactea]
MDDADGRQPVVSCAWCGRQQAGPPITWVLESDPRRGPVYYCDDCARQHLRAIESRLDQQWW